MSCHRKKFLGIRRNFLSQKETFCHGKEFHAIVRNFLSQEEISCHRMKFLVRGRNVLLQEEISRHRKKLLVTGTNFMPQLKFLVIRRNTQITAILDVFCRVWLPLFWAKFLAECIGSHEVKYFIIPWEGESVKIWHFADARWRGGGSCPK